MRSGRLCMIAATILTGSPIWSSPAATTGRWTSWSPGGWTPRSSIPSCDAPAPDPMRRFPNAEAANLVDEGAAAFHRQLVLTNLSAEYDNEIRLWLNELKELEEMAESD